jgi:hypothetical protein
MLRSSVEALISRRNRDGHRLPHSACPDFATPHQRQPGDPDRARERERAIASWFSPAETLGLASGAGFALSAVGYRGAALALDTALPWVAAIYSLVWAQAIQSVLLGGYLAVRDRAGLRKVMMQWRVSTLAGLMGALASFGWLTAFAMRSAVDARRRPGRSFSAMPCLADVSGAGHSVAISPAFC